MLSQLHLHNLGLAKSLLAMEDQHHLDHDVAVVAVPLPAQGHLNQMLHLTRVLSARGLPVHYIGSATHNRQAKERVHGWDPLSMSNIHFHDFQLPQPPATPSPDPQALAKFPGHLLPTFDAAWQLREPLGVLLRDLCATNRRVVVVFDSLMSFAAHEASLVPNAEAYCFDSCSVFAILQFRWETIGRPAEEEGNLIPKDMPHISFDSCFNDEFLKYAYRTLAWLEYRAGDLYNTCDAIEGKFITMLTRLQPGKELWGIGPLNPVSFEPTEVSHHKCIEWLDEQPPASVIYVSFGTMTSLSDHEITELAKGLEHSEQRFVWVLRGADRGDIYEGEARKAQLPDGFEERVKGVGIIVRDWAPQLQILAHPSAGGFMSHCGWNSTMESLSMGVPIAAWPMHSDQPGNALLLTEVLKVGLIVREWARREELIKSDTIEKAIRKLMVSEEGSLMRKRASELGINVRRCVSGGGSSATQLESFLAHISR